MKKGFTLAEILVSLGVIGIVAAMTIPTLVSSQKKQLWANSLPKAMNTLSNASSIMIMKDGAYGLFDSKAWEEMEAGTPVSDAILAHLSNTMIINSAAYTAVPKTLYGTEVPDLFKDYTAFSTKGDITYFIKPILLENNAIHYDIEMIAADVLVDINGNEIPNIIGRDIFGFLLTNEGRMLPYGTVTANEVVMLDAVTTSAGNTTRYTNSWKTKCPDSTKRDYGFACTGKVLKEDTKMNY